MTQNQHSDEGKKNHYKPANESEMLSAKLPRRKKASPPFTWLDGPYNYVRGETALWIAVITQAMMDALSRSSNAEMRYHKHEAIRWLSDNSKDFIQVCLLAGLDPSYVRRKAKRSLVSPRQWRAAPGKGKRYLERKAYRRRLKKSMVKPPVALMAKTASDDKVIRGPW